MTREEEIQNYAYNNCITEDVDDTSYSIIVDAIKWADETMIDKACKWLNKTLYIHTEIEEDKDWGETNSTNWVTSDYDTVGEFITAFRQAMEGGAE